jgi:hypothetical protein
MDLKGAFRVILSQERQYATIDPINHDASATAYPGKHRVVNA